MPTYSYHCKKCNTTVDVFHAMSATPRVKCGECKTVRKRLMGTGAGIIFRGSGFYETDYKSKTGTPPASESKSDAPSAKAGESAKKSESTKSSSAEMGKKAAKTAASN